MKHVLLSATLFFTNSIHTQQDRKPLGRSEFIVHPSRCFNVADVRIFENGGLNENARVVCKRGPATGNPVYIRNYGSTYYANKNTLIRALSWGESQLAMLLITEGNIPLNDADKDGLTPLRAALLFNEEQHEFVIPLLNRGALVHNPPHHTAYQLLTDVLKFLAKIPPAPTMKALLKQGIPHLSPADKTALSEQAEETRAIHNELLTNFERGQKAEAYRITWKMLSTSESDKLSPTSLANQSPYIIHYLNKRHRSNMLELQFIGR